MIPSTVGRVPVNTASHVNEAIRRKSWEDVRRTIAAGPEAVDRRLDELDREWDFERALETHAAAAVLVGLGLGAFVDRRFLVLPATVAGFLLLHAVQGWCPPLPIYRRLGIRTQREIDDERDDLRALRGDFRDPQITRRNLGFDAG